MNFVNHAPKWLVSAANLTPVLPGSAPSAGNSVSGAAGIFSDVDGNNVGMAIIGATGKQWHLGLLDQGGTTWTSFGALGTNFGVPSLSNALLLSASDLIRIVPRSGFVGPATLSAHAWDGMQGSAATAGSIKGFAIPARGEHQLSAPPC